MTSWLPDIGRGPGPLYMRLAETIERDIAGGALPAGAKLPPQRDLAYDIGVTIGTVGRAYAIARERGLVSGEVGRGTFVRGKETSPASPPAGSVAVASGSPTAGRPEGKLVMDSTSAPDVGQSREIERLAARIVRENPDTVVDYTRSWPEHWREAGSRWLSVSDWKPEPSSVVPTLGVHAAAMAVMTAMTAPGDRIAFEELTYASISRSANLLGRRSVMIGRDAQGTDPEDFDRLCAQQHPKMAFLIPTLHNPTLGSLSLERRRAIAGIARRHNVWLIEDSIYAALLESQPASLSELAPERTFHVGGLSKTVAAGLRGGWVACPPGLAPRVQTAHKMVTGGIPFLLAELAAQLVVSGEADRVRERVRHEIAARESIARECFEGLEFASDPHAPFLWMKLPDPWLSGTFRLAAATEGVLVDDEDEYKPGRTGAIHHRIRVGFSNPPTRDAVRSGFATIRRLVDNPNAGYDSYG